jgi:hypothetical protein
MALALTANKRLGIAYLPANDAIKVDLRGCAPEYTFLWINPATGQWQDGTAMASSPKTTLVAPDKKDWDVVFASSDSQAVTKVKSALTGAISSNGKSTASIVFTKNATFDGLV